MEERLLTGTPNPSRRSVETELPEYLKMMVDSQTRHLPLDGFELETSQEDTSRRNTSFDFTKEYKFSEESAQQGAFEQTYLSAPFYQQQGYMNWTPAGVTGGSSVEKSSVHSIRELVDLQLHSTKQLLQQSLQVAELGGLGSSAPVAWVGTPINSTRELYPPGSDPLSQELIEPVDLRSVQLRSGENQTIKVVPSTLISNVGNSMSSLGSQEPLYSATYDYTPQQLNMFTVRYNGTLSEIIEETSDAMIDTKSSDTGGNMNFPQNLPSSQIEYEISSQRSLPKMNKMAFSPDISKHNSLRRDQIHSLRIISHTDPLIANGGNRTEGYYSPVEDNKNHSTIYHMNREAFWSPEEFHEHPQSMPGSPVHISISNDPSMFVRLGSKVEVDSSRALLKGFETCLIKKSPPSQKLVVHPVMPIEPSFAEDPIYTESCYIKRVRAITHPNTADLSAHNKGENPSKSFVVEGKKLETGNNWLQEDKTHHVNSLEGMKFPEVSDSSSRTDLSKLFGRSNPDALRGAGSKLTRLELPINHNPYRNILAKPLDNMEHQATFNSAEHNSFSVDVHVPPSDADSVLASPLKDFDSAHSHIIQPRCPPSTLTDLGSVINLVKPSQSVQCLPRFRETRPTVKYGNESLDGKSRGVGFNIKQLIKDNFDYEVSFEFERKLKEERQTITNHLQSINLMLNMLGDSFFRKKASEAVRTSKIDPISKRTNKRPASSTKMASEKEKSRVRLSAETISQELESGNLEMHSDPFMSQKLKQQCKSRLIWLNKASFLKPKKTTEDTDSQMIISLQKKMLRGNSRPQHSNVQATGLENLSPLGSEGPVNKLKQVFKRNSERTTSDHKNMFLTVASPSNKEEYNKQPGLTAESKYSTFSSESRNQESAPESKRVSYKTGNSGRLGGPIPHHSSSIGAFKFYNTRQLKIPQAMVPRLAHKELTEKNRQSAKARSSKSRELSRDQMSVYSKSKGINKVSFTAAETPARSVDKSRTSKPQNHNLAGSSANQRRKPQNSHSRSSASQYSARSNNKNVVAVNIKDLQGKAFRRETG